jgi:hypothetical protein
MTTSQTRTRSGLRSALAGASALVVVALVLGSDLKPVRPAAREFQRESAVERAATRHLTASLARAVRELVGGQAHTPAIHTPLGIDLGLALRPGSNLPAASAEHFAPVILLRAALLDLPPPTTV